MTRGLYRITHRESWRSYFGRSKNVEDRLKEHCDALRLGKHHNQHLQRAWNKYGELAFDLELLIATPNATIKEMIVHEDHYIKGAGYYNIMGGVIGGWSFKTPEQLKKQVFAFNQTVSKMSKEERLARWSRPGDLNGMYGRTTSDLQKQSVVKANLGKKRSYEHRKIVSDLKIKIFSVKLPDGSEVWCRGGTALAEFLGVDINHARYLISSSITSKRGNYPGACVTRVSV